MYTVLSMNIHCMGIMGIVTPSCKMNTAQIKKETVLKSNNNIKYLRQSGVTASDLQGCKIRNSRLNSISWPSPRRHRSDTHVHLISSLCTLGVVEWVEYSDGKRPGVSSFVFLPIIDLPPTDMNCVYSTLLFIKAHRDSDGKQAVITFDQPLYLKVLI